MRRCRWASPRTRAPLLRPPSCCWKKASGGVRPCACAGPTAARAWRLQAMCWAAGTFVPPSPSSPPPAAAAPRLRCALADVCSSLQPLTPGDLLLLTGKQAGACGWEPAMCDSALLPSCCDGRFCKQSILIARSMIGPSHLVARPSSCPESFLSERAHGNISWL